MAWRGVHISQAARLGLKARQFIVSQDEGEVSLPIEDIAYIIIDTQQVTITGAAMAALAEGGVALIQSDAKHHPTYLALPFHAHHKQSEIAHLQIGVTEPFKKRCWQAIVQAKILNQYSHLCQQGMDANVLKAMATRVKSGDPDNLEAQAARIYWGRLFSEFRRQDENDIRNAYLNYGYAIVRACIARALVASGLLPAFGLNHSSVTNAFNLADDLIEPFRATVDAHCISVIDDIGKSNPELSLEARRCLTRVMDQSVVLGDEVMSLLAATEVMVFSLVRAMRMKDQGLLVLPKFQLVRP